VISDHDAGIDVAWKIYQQALFDIELMEFWSPHLSRSQRPEMLWVQQAS